MSTENQVVKSTEWQEQIALVKSMVARGATDEEFKLMCHIANKYGLDPLAKQIWVVKYGTMPASIFTGRDGFLSIAHQTNQFGGMETKVEKVNEPIDVVKTRYNKDRQKITVEVKRDWQYKATCIVKRKDSDSAFISEVFEEEYTTAENLWTSKPRTMIGKVAESQCLRKAFNISGLYSPEEMPDPEPRDITPEKAETDLQRIKKLPKDIQDGFARYKLLEGKDLPQGDFRAAVARIMTDNNDDPEQLRAFLNDKGCMTEMPKQGEEGLPQ
jgi:phage recombination protein Bet